MSTPTRIVVAARPGHSRDSLIALLRTIPQVELAMVNEAGQPNLDLPDKAAADILLVDLDSYGSLCSEVLSWLRKARPSARRVLLADRCFPYPSGQYREADCVLSKTTPAGEFLQAIRLMIDQKRPDRSNLSLYPLTPAIKPF